MDASRDHEVTDVFEGDGVIVEVVLEGVFEFPETLIVTADVNFNGQIESSERYVVDGIYGGGLIHEFPLHFEDDGEWPGNTTPSDPVEIEVLFAGDTERVTIGVQNLDPQITSHTSLTTERHATGEEAVLTVFLIDAGVHDEHTITVTWGDGETTTSDDFEASVACPGVNCQRVEVRRNIVPGVELTPLTIDVADDDQGADRYSILRQDVVRNNDDDDESDVEDLFERGVTGEDDIVALDLSALITDEMDPATGRFVLSYDTGVIRLWDSVAKRNFIRPYGAFVGGPSGLVSVPTINYVGQTPVYVEGVGAGLTEITLGWIPNSQLDSWDPIAFACDSFSSHGGRVQVHVWGIDLDIDSDNDDALGLPKRDDREEFLEGNEFAIGKMLYMDDTDYTPVVLNLPPGLDPDDPKYKVRLDFVSPTASSGTALIWLQSKSASTGSSHSPLIGGEYSLRELGYQPNGRIILYLEAQRWTQANATLMDVERNGKTDDMLMATLKVGYRTQVKDLVKFMIVGPKLYQPPYLTEAIPWRSFYPELQRSRALRSAGAADAVYAPASNLNFTLKMLDGDEIRELLEGKLSERDIDILVSNLTGNWAPGDGEPPVADLTMRLYLDHVTLTYILAFKGTDFPRLDDWVANLQNDLTGHSAQYERSMYVAYLLAQSGIPFHNAGHSLGGGLATAASMVTGHFADTFNAAGLNPAALYRNDYWSTDPDIPWYPGTPLYVLLQKALINAYQVWETRPLDHFPPLDSAPDPPHKDASDILSYLQDLGSPHFVGGIPLAHEAWGRHINIEGLYNLTLMESFALNKMRGAVDDFFEGRIGSAAWKAIWAAIWKGDVLDKMTKSHSFPSIYFGLLHDLDGWNIYDHGSHPY